MASEDGKATPKELTVLEAVASEGGNKLAAAKLGISVHTVSSHMRNMRRKSGAHSLPQLLEWGRKQCDAAAESVLPVPKSKLDASNQSISSSFEGLSDLEWARMLGEFPKDPRRGRHRADLRAVVNGLFYRVFYGCSFRQLPAGFGSRSTCSRYYREWINDGTWMRIWRIFISGLSEAERLAWLKAFLIHGYAPLFLDH